MRRRVSIIQGGLRRGSERLEFGSTWTLIHTLHGLSCCIFSSACGVDAVPSSISSLLLPIDHIDIIQYFQ
jgi:hypothetical protein